MSGKRDAAKAVKTTEKTTIDTVLSELVAVRTRIQLLEDALDKLVEIDKRHSQQSTKEK